LRVQDKKTSQITVIPLNAPISINQTIVGFVFTTVCDDTSQYLQIRCQLTKNCGPKGLLDQYYYNTTYPGVSTAQHSYDLGRYYGYKQGTSQQPLSVAPGP
jgi:hypothetical protein